MLKDAQLDELYEHAVTAEGIAWDGCHKIYVIMDSGEMAKMRELEYNHLVPCDGLTPYEVVDKVLEWYEDSCGLRFVEAVSTQDETYTDFHVIIGQFEDGEDEDEDEDED